MWIFRSSPLSGRVLGLLRIVAGVMFMAAGTSKLFGFPSSGMPTVNLFSQIGAAGVIEAVGGLVVALGLLTRPAAFVMSGEMAWAYFQVHQPKAPFPTMNGGVPAVLYCFLFLYFAFAGGGPWSLDALVARPRTPAPTVP